MSDYYQLWKSLFSIKDFLTQHNTDKFTSFDLTNNPNQIQGNSFKVSVKSAEDVVYYLKFYNLLGELTEKDIDNVYVEKGFIGFDKVYLILIV